MGGQVSLVLNARDPRVCGEVVIAPAYGVTDAEAATAAPWADRIKVEGHAAVRGFFIEAAGALPADRRRRIVDDALETEPRVIADYLRSEYLGPAAVGRADQAAQLARRRRAPVLALYSTDAAAEFERRNAGSFVSIEVWRGHGHYLHLEEPDRFCARVLEWMLRLSPALEPSDDVGRLSIVMSSRRPKLSRSGEGRSPTHG